jgi:hypothetical protein
MGLAGARGRWHAACTIVAREVTTMDLSTIMNPAVIPPGTLGLMLEPAAFFATWIGLVVVVLAGLTSVLGMEGRDETARERVARTPHLVSRAPRVEAAA